MPDRIAQFEALVARQPENGLFRFSLAQVLLDAGRGPEAVPHLEFCVQKKADWMLPRILLGKELLRAGQTDAARPLLEAALQLAIEQDHDDPAAELRELLTDL
jgi:predicted Zn-dependent protease